MNKQQREYTIDRINHIAKSKQFECECEKPSLQKHIRRALAQGTAKLKPAKVITRHFEIEVIENSSHYSEPSAKISDLFEEPQSYRDAMAELKSEQDKHASVNSKTMAYAQGLIDRVNLGEFEDGKEPIRLMEAHDPAAPAKKR